MENKNNNYNKELINGQYYSNKEGTYFPSEKYLKHLKEHREGRCRIGKPRQ